MAQKQTTMWCVVLQPKGTTRNAMIPADSTALPDAAGAGSILRRQTAPEYIGSWKWNHFVIHLFGYKTGKAGTENKNELPPPHDKILLFGEAIVFACKDGALVNFDTKEFAKFYNETLAGFEDLGDEDTDDEDDDSEEEEEEEGEAEESAGEEEEEEADVPVVESDDEDDRPVPPPRVVAKAKRTNKKIRAWFSLPELKPEPYTLTKAS